MRIFKTKWFDRFARKFDIPNSMLIEAVERAENGLVDADLGSGVLKQRIARAGEGKSKGHRAIILLRKGDRAFFVYGFSKKDRDSLRQDEEERFRKMAGSYFSLSESDLSGLLAIGDFMEVKNG
ncbi:MAG: hypothetical protein K0R76_1212 [Alphaproteobacteria bacterium]|nr:hypothetical protein [Alphaproteobacteria bacterium]